MLENIFTILNILYRQDEKVREKKQAYLHNILVLLLFHT